MAGLAAPTQDKKRAAGGRGGAGRVEEKGADMMNALASGTVVTPSPKGAKLTNEMLMTIIGQGGPKPRALKYGLSSPKQERPAGEKRESNVVNDVVMANPNGNDDENGFGKDKSKIDATVHKALTSSALDMRLGVDKGRRGLKWNKVENPDYYETSDYEKSENQLYASSSEDSPSEDPMEYFYAADDPRAENSDDVICPPKKKKQKKERGLRWAKVE